MFSIDRPFIDWFPTGSRLVGGFGMCSMIRAKSGVLRLNPGFSAHSPPILRSRSAR